MSTISNLLLQSQRFLDGVDPDGGYQDATTSDPTKSSTTAPMDENANSVEGKYGLAAIILVGFGILLIFWQSCKRWQLQRERRLLQIQSSRANAVLGDMQMVPADDDFDEDDPELL